MPCAFLCLLIGAYCRTKHAGDKDAISQNAAGFDVLSTGYLDIMRVCSAKEHSMIGRCARISDKMHTFGLKNTGDAK